MLPALRQPKMLNNNNKVTHVSSDIPKLIKKNFTTSESHYMIVKLKDNRKFVVSSDAYHGVLIAGEVFKCVFCNVDITLDPVRKENHKNSAEHKKKMESYPHIESYAQNLVRKLDKENFYCTICNVLVSWSFISRHITSEVHLQELERAGTRSNTYKEIY